jgi:threonine dehydratase
MALAFETPLVRLGNLFPDREVYAKCEFLAPSGSFKIRGASHLLEHLGRQGQTRQLVVPSMGNTALGAALGAKHYGFRMVGVVPKTIGQAKDEKLKALGVELIKIAGKGSDLLAHASQVAEERKGYFVHPHLDLQWTDGYQAILQEILSDLPNCQSLVFPVGGGGLLMGLTNHLMSHPASIQLFGCEAYNYPTYANFDHPRSATIADGLILDEPHPPVQKRIKELRITIPLISDDAIRTAMAGLYAKQGMAVEPSSAITVALAQTQPEAVTDPVCLVLTGENVAREDFFRLIAKESA